MCPSEPSGIGPQEHGRGLVEKELQGPRLDAGLTREPQSNIAEKDRHFTFRMITPWAGVPHDVWSQYQPTIY